MWAIPKMQEWGKGEQAVVMLSQTQAHYIAQATLAVVLLCQALSW